MKILLIGLLALSSFAVFAKPEIDSSRDLLSVVGRRTFTLKVIKPIELSSGQTVLKLGNHCRMTFRWDSEARVVDGDKIVPVHMAGLETNRKKNSIGYVMSVEDPQENILTLSCYGLRLSDDFTVDQFSSEISDYLEIEALPVRIKL